MSIWSRLRRRGSSGDASDKSLVSFEFFTLPWAVAVVIIASSALVAVGYWRYSVSDARKYDIARPGQGVSVGIEDVTDTDDMSSPVDASAIASKRRFLDDQYKILQSTPGFDELVLSDQNIQLMGTAITPQQ